MRSLVILGLVSLGFLVGVVGCSQPDGTQDPTTKKNELTYYGQIKTIVETKCNNCHTQKGIGPMDFTNYDQVKKFKDSIHDSVKKRRMPPWQADNTCNDYVGNFDLTDKERTTLLKWIDSGAPKGNPDDYKKVAKKTSGLSRVDLSVKTPNYKPKLSPDDYRCFVIDWPKKETSFISGFRVKPGNGKLVHHVIAFVASPDKLKTYLEKDKKEAGEGYTCYGAPGGREIPTWAGSWAPGGNGRDYPAGTGIRVEPGSKLIVQVHYNTIADTDGSDTTTLEFKLEKEVKSEAIFLPFTNYLSWYSQGGMKIPAGQTNVKHQFALDISSFTKTTFTIHSAALHMHTRGTSGRLWINKGGTSKNQQCVLKVPQWDFNWQGGFELKKPVELKPGDELGIGCTWDNSAKNQPVINGVQQKPKDIHWGDGTNDEMCLGILYVTCKDLDGKGKSCQGVLTRRR